MTFPSQISQPSDTGQTGTGTHRQRNADTSTPSKQRDRHGVTHTTHHPGSQPSNSDSTGRRQAHPRRGSLEGKEVLSRKGALVPKHRPTTMPARSRTPRTPCIQRIPRHPNQWDAVQPMPRQLSCHKDTQAAPHLCNDATAHLRLGPPPPTAATHGSHAHWPLPQSANAHPPMPRRSAQRPRPERAYSRADGPGWESCPAG